MSEQMLPISVLVPTRNSMSLLPRHIEAMRSWVPIVDEVVAVDSHSTDGTLELLQREFGPNGRVLTHPPGLYQSWNFGLQQCRAKFVYISTVGDTISREGLERLFAAAEQFHADVVISPPAMIDTENSPVEKTWPVHTLVDGWRLESPACLAGAAAQSFAFVNLRRGILGSSASNLYQTELLQRLPFRTDFGTAGDLAWGLEHSGQIRLGVLPERVSTFVFHPKSYAKSDYAVDDFAGRCLALARRSALKGDALQQQVLDAWERFLTARNAVETAKQSSTWFLSPAAWNAHRARAVAARGLGEVQRQAMATLRTQAILS
jgi:glycosyltransferase involved in cell wall biosynthesis